MSKLSKPLSKFCDVQIANQNVVAKPFSGSCMFCGKKLQNRMMTTVFATYVGVKYNLKQS